LLHQALRFMIDAEQVEGAGHFWSELPLPRASAPAAAAAGASGSNAGAADAACVKVWFSPMLNRLTREEPAVTRGGLLASEMGLGKTIVSLACVLAAPQTPAVTAAKAAEYAAALTAAPNAAAKKRVLIPTHATLVVCAVSLVGQWIAEAQVRAAYGAGVVCV
jgi:SNF2 family DNA or RNA helicase